eukprot:4102640-Amphidinium_carterae.1
MWDGGCVSNRGWWSSSSCSCNMWSDTVLKKQSACRSQQASHNEKFDALFKCGMVVAFQI